MRKVIALLSCVVSFVLFASTGKALQPSDWPVWGQNPANTRSNPAETSVPPSSLTLSWSTVPGGGTGNAGIGGVRYGVIANNALYGSYVTGNAAFVEGRVLTGALKGTMLAGWPNLPPTPGRTIPTRWTYFSPAFIQTGFPNGLLSLAVGGFGANPCGPSFAGVQSLDATTSALSTKTPVGLPNPASRIGVGGTAVDATGKFYASAFCPTTVVQPVNTYKFSVPTGPFAPWPNGAFPNQYRQFTSGDTLASFSPAVANGAVALALARPSTAACPFPAAGTGELKIIDDATGTDSCTFGPFVTGFDNTPPAIVGNIVYSVNFTALGPTAFSLAACASNGGSGSCNTVLGSAGPLGGHGFCTANGFVFTSGAGPAGTEIQMWDANLQTLIDTFTVVDNAGTFAVEPYIAEANGFVYGVDANGLVFAVGYNTSPAGFTGVVSYSTDTVGFAGGPFGVESVGEGAVVVSSPSLVRVYNLQPAGTASFIPPQACLPPFTEAWMQMDSAFDHTTGKLIDARIMGIIDSGGAFGSSEIGQEGLVYDPSSDTWNCFSGMPFPAGQPCMAVHTTGLSIVDNSTFWALGQAGGCFTPSGDTFAWQANPSNPPPSILPPTWNGPFQGTTPSTWNGTGAGGLAMIRGAGPLTGWASMDTGVAFFNGAWGNPSTLVGGFASLKNISFPDGDPVNGYAADFNFNIWFLNGSGVWTLIGSPPATLASIHSNPVTIAGQVDVWDCGLLINPSPFSSQVFIGHTTTSGVQPVQVPVPAPAEPSLAPANLPSLFDITFYELGASDPAHWKGVAVGGTFGQVAGAPPIVYITENHGQSWTQVPVTLPANYVFSGLTYVRFVDSKTAYAIGPAANAAGHPLPLLVKIKL